MQDSLPALSASVELESGRLDLALGEELAASVPELLAKLDIFGAGREVSTSPLNSFAKDGVAQLILGVHERVNVLEEALGDKRIDCREDALLGAAEGTSGNRRVVIVGRGVPGQDQIIAGDLADLAHQRVGVLMVVEQDVDAEGAQIVKVVGGRRSDDLEAGKLGILNTDYGRSGATAANEQSLGRARRRGGRQRQLEELVQRLADRSDGYTESSGSFKGQVVGNLELEVGNGDNVVTESAVVCIFAVGGVSVCSATHYRQKHLPAPNHATDAVAFAPALDVRRKVLDHTSVVNAQARTNVVAVAPVDALPVSGVQSYGLGFNQQVACRDSQLWRILDFDLANGGDVDCSRFGRHFEGWEEE